MLTSDPCFRLHKILDSPMKIMHSPTIQKKIFEYVKEEAFRIRWQNEPPSRCSHKSLSSSRLCPSQGYGGVSSLYKNKKIALERVRNYG